MITIIEATIQPSSSCKPDPVTTISTSEINLSWNASSDNIGVTGYSYSIETVLPDYYHIKHYLSRYRT